jgi:O-antigen/teichoic acid export membrane protein
MNSGRPSVRKALSLSFTRTGVNFAFNIATVTIVSRLLTPSEIGIFSVAVALVTLVHMLRDFGVSEFIVQEKSLTDDLIRTAFSINLIIAWTLAGLVFGLSSLIGMFYGDPGVAKVTRVLSLVFVLMPFGTTTLSCMKREMEFAIIVKLQMAETAVRSTSTIALAYFGYSYMSMAWASVAAMAVLVSGSMLFGGEYRIRGFGFAGWRRVLHFGSYRTASDIVAQFGAQSANIVVGKLLGMAAAGFYSRGYGIVNIFRVNVVGAIGTVAFPAYAREHREGNAAPWLYRKSLVYLTGVSWPFFGFAILMAFPLIRIAFGSQWDAAVPLMRWLCGAAIVGTLVFQVNGLLTAVGYYRDVTRIEIQYQSVRVVLAVLAALYSLEAVAASQVAVYVVAVLLYYRRLVRFDALRWRILARALAPSAILAILTSSVPAAVLMLWPKPVDQQYVPIFFISAGGSAIAWLGGIFLVKHPLAAEIKNGFFVLRARLRRNAAIE